MFTALIIFAAVVGVPLLVVLFVASTMPDTFWIARSVTVKAPPEAIFPLIADFKSWTKWSLWEHRDFDLKRRYTGSPGTVGHAYFWDGGKNAGAGNMTVTEVEAPESLMLTLHFTRPLKAQNFMMFSLTAQDDSTVVSWEMQGPLPFMSKIMHIFISMDKMVGGDFERGLANIKAIAETAASAKVP